MSLLRLESNPSPRQLRTFALGWLALGAVAGLSLWLKGRTGAGEGVWAAAVLVPAAGTAWPRGLRWLYVGLSYAAYPPGLVVSWALLALIYFGALTPLGWILRLARRDPLQRRPDPAAAGYWQRRPPPPDPETYFRQY